jgi:carnitine O-acetyltransferase
MTDTPPTTFGFEDSLPRVPIPDLEASGARFLEWCAPLLTEEQLATTRATVDEFLAPDSPARAGYARILEREATPGVHSWLDEFWRDRYLGRRVRTAINANFFFLLHDYAGGQFERASGLIMGALDHKSAIDEERFPPTTQRGSPLSMDQHKYLFSSTRIPSIERDHPRTPYTAEWPGPSTERHILVLVLGNLFRLNVIGPEGVPHTLDELAGALKAIAGSVTGRGPGVGHLTSLDRADWAQVRERLLAHHPDNRDAMDVVERALIAICLELSSPDGVPATCDELLAGDSGNRWFDKAISFVVFPNGRAGLQGEHSNLDGTTVAEFIESVVRRSHTEHAQAAGARSQGQPEWSPVAFVLDDALSADIQHAHQSFEQFSEQATGELVDIPGFGSNVPKQLGMSPDAFMQLAFQLSHHRAKGFLGATYESISMRRYHHGRTEAMRVVTPEIVAFVDAMADPATGPAERAAFARAAAAEHVARAKGCQTDQAPEQLIWELQLEERRHGLDSQLAIYDSPGWQIMRDDYLSTSTVSSAHVVILGFGATSGRCIGVAYQLLPDHLTIYLSTPTPIADGMVMFIAELPRAIDDLAAVLRNASEEPAGRADQ